MALAGAIFLLGPARIGLREHAPPKLVAALVGTVRATVALGALLTLGLVLA